MLIGLGAIQLDHLSTSARTANLAVGLQKIFLAVILAGFLLMSVMNLTFLKHFVLFWAIRVLGTGFVSTTWQWQWHQWVIRGILSVVGRALLF
jgi:hypothetical protein